MDAFQEHRDDEYKEMYYRLFNKLSDLAEEINNIQREAEEFFISYREYPEERE